MNAEQLLEIPGLQYVQMPVPSLVWCPGMDPFALVLVEEWPGYVDTKNHWLKQSKVDADALIAAGWTVEELTDWTRYHPPGGPRPPAPPPKTVPAGLPPAGTQAENAQPPTSRYTTTPPGRRANPTTITARYADGRPARRADGTVITYDAAGRPVEFTPRGAF